MNPHQAVTDNLDTEGLGVGHSSGVSGVTTKPWPEATQGRSPTSHKYPVANRGTLTVSAVNGTSGEFEYAYLDIRTVSYYGWSIDGDARLRRVLPDMIRETEQALAGLRRAAATRGIKIDD